MVNAGTLKALERKGAAKKKTRPAPFRRTRHFCIHWSITGRFTGPVTGTIPVNVLLGQ